MLLLEQDSAYACDYPPAQPEYKLTTLRGPASATSAELELERMQLGESATLYGDGQGGVLALRVDPRDDESTTFEVRP